MAKYLSEPFYGIKLAKSQFEFDHNGIYETDKPEEITELDKMVPTWITRIEETKAKPKQEKAEEKAQAPVKTAPRKAPIRKTSAK